MHSLENLKKSLPEAEEKLGYFFQNKNLLILALTHRSFVNECREIDEHNERLEFLGDSVLGLATADFLYHRLPEFPEGPLSQLRSRLVDASSCAHYLQKMGMQKFILVGKGESMHEGKAKTSILADAFEAIVAAIFLDGGLLKAKEFLSVQFESDMEAVIQAPSRNYKAELQDYAQKKFQNTPVYEVIQEEGPDHAKTFSVRVLVQEKEAGVGHGNTKKQAEQKAAFEALSKIEDQNRE